MHVVFGGIFNGKTAYVMAHYEPTIVVDGRFPQQLPVQEIVAIRNFQALARPYLHIDEVEAATKILEHIEKLSASNTVICICDDMSRGVVPIDAEERQTRDVLGRLYQQLFTKAETVTQIWYGIPQQLK